MKKVTLYSWTYCPYCVRAKNLLDQKNVRYEEIILDDLDSEREALINRTGMKTVPQIFIGDFFVGGFSDLSSLEQKGQLDELLKEP